MSEDAELIRKKINLQRKVDKYLVNSLINVARKLQEDGLEDIDLIHRIIMRSLFLLYLEDRGATDTTFYSNITKDAKSYFDILRNVESTFQLYKKLDKHFNGNVFTLAENEENQVNQSHLEVIKNCFISGYEETNQLNLFDNWRLFDFSIIQIELLSEIYENFLSELDRSNKEETGTFYTPPSLVELILNEKLSTNLSNTNYQIKILDPACGSGIFLVESFKRLVKRYRNNKGLGLIEYDELKQLLLDNIFGIELNPKSIKVAAFSLYLALLDNLNPKTLWLNKTLPYLINDPDDSTLKEQGSNLFRRDTISKNPEIEAVEFDLVVGNPPFGTSKLLPSIVNYCKRFGFAKEMVLPFLHKSIRFSPNGEIALIFNTKILTNTGSTYKKFRNWLFNDCYVERVYNFSILRKAPQNFGGQLFGSAVGPISIIFYQKKAPKNYINRVLYYAPKTYVKSNVLEGIVIDSTDLKFIPREECQKPDTKIWKVAMWGGVSDSQLLERLKSRATLGEYLKKKKVVKGLGLQFLDKSTKNPITDIEVPNQYIPPQGIRRYVSNHFINLHEGLTAKSKAIYEAHFGSNQEIKSINVFRRLGAKAAYQAPHILIKEGLTNWRICSSYVDQNSSFNSKVLGIHSKDERMLKGLTCFLNSSFVYYYLFILSASIGIEREEIKPNEIYNVPFGLSDQELYSLADLFDKAIELNSFLEEDLSSFEQEVDNLVFRYFDISSKESIIIKDFIEYSIPLLFKGVNSPAVKSTNANNIKNYSKRLCSELNEFLDGQELRAFSTTFKFNKSSPLILVKISFDVEEKGDKFSDESLIEELKDLDKRLWDQRATNIFFKKRLNYYEGNDIYIIRPNQQRYWTESVAMEDASELILEILNSNQQ